MKEYTSHKEHLWSDFFFFLMWAQVKREGEEISKEPQAAIQLRARRNFCWNKILNTHSRYSGNIITSRLAGKTQLWCWESFCPSSICWFLFHGRFRLELRQRGQASYKKGLSDGLTTRPSIHHSTIHQCSWKSFGLRIDVSSFIFV